MFQKVMVIFLAFTDRIPEWIMKNRFKGSFIPFLDIENFTKHKFRFPENIIAFFIIVLISCMLVGLSGLKSLISKGKLFFIDRNRFYAKGALSLDGKTTGGNTHPFSETDGNIVRIRTGRQWRKCCMGSIHYYRNATGFTFFDKVLIIGRITIVSTDKENTDLRDHLFLKHRGKIFVKIIIMNFISCFYKAAQNCFAVIGRQICHTLLIC